MWLSWMLRGEGASGGRYWEERLHGHMGCFVYDHKTEDWTISIRTHSGSKGAIGSTGSMGLTRLAGGRIGFYGRTGAHQIPVSVGAVDS